MDQDYRRKQDSNRMLIKKQLSSLCVLLRQGLAIRGDNYEDGKLILLLKTRSEDIPECKEWVKNKDYLSPDIINEQMEEMALNVLRSLVEDVQRNCGLYSLIADESKDISNKEQLSCVVRWVSNEDMTIHEGFIGM